MNLQDYADHLELLGVQALNKRNTTVSFKQCAEYLERVIIDISKSPLIPNTIAYDWQRFVGSLPSPLPTDISLIRILEQARQKLSVLATDIEKQPNVLICTALHAEFQALTRKWYGYPDWQPIESKEPPILRRRGIYSGLRLLGTTPDTMGLVHTAIHVTQILTTWRPQLAIMIGICGGLPDEVSIGDIIVAEVTFHYQFGAFKDGKIEYQLRIESIEEQLKLKLQSIINDEKAVAIQKKLENLGIKVPENPTKMRLGIMGCADLVVKDLSKLKEAKGVDRKVHSIDMESYAFMRACKANGVPGLVVKVVQDLIEKKTDEFREYAIAAAGEACLFLLRELVS